MKCKPNLRFCAFKNRSRDPTPLQEMLHMKGLLEHLPCSSVGTKAHRTSLTPNSKHTPRSWKTKSHSPNEPEEVSTKTKGITSSPDPCNAEQYCLCCKLLVQPCFHWIQRDFHPWFQWEKNRVLCRAEPKLSSFLSRNHGCVVVKIRIRKQRWRNPCENMVESSSYLVVIVSRIR